MSIRRALGRVVHGADAHEAHRRTCAGIVAPDGNLADGAARDALALAAGRGRIDDLGLCRDVLDALGLIHRVERVHRSRLALAPGTVAGMHDHRLADEAIADVPAGATAFHDRFLFRGLIAPARLGTH